MAEFLNTLNTNSGVIQSIAIIILVIITGIYAYFTYRMAKLMEKQVIADIQVSNVIIGSCFVEQWFKERLEKQSDQIDRHSYFEFNLLFDVRNRSSGSGSIDKPTLVLEFTNDGFKYEVSPKTKSIRWHTTQTTPYQVQEEEITDFGGTIFLHGGESRKIELEYNLYDFSDKLLKHVKENLDSLEYYIRFSDNLGKNYLIKIDDIGGEREVRRE